MALACALILPNLHAGSDKSDAVGSEKYFGAPSGDNDQTQANNYRTYRQTEPAPKELIDGEKIEAAPPEAKEIVESEKVEVPAPVQCVIQEKPSYIREDIVREKPVVVKEHIVEKPVVLREHVVHEKRIIKERIIHEIPVIIKERIVHRMAPVFMDVPCGYVERGYIPCYNDVLAVNKVEWGYKKKKARCHKYKYQYQPYDSGWVENMP